MNLLKLEEDTLYSSGLRKEASVGGNSAPYRVLPYRVQEPFIHFAHGNKT